MANYLRAVIRPYSRSNLGGTLTRRRARVHDDEADGDLSGMYGMPRLGRWASLCSTQPTSAFLHSQPGPTASGLGSVPPQSRSYSPSFANP